jgi:hypothetical protein
MFLIFFAYILYHKSRTSEHAGLARPIEAPASVREEGSVISSFISLFLGYWIALNLKRSCQCLGCDLDSPLA